MFDKLKSIVGDQKSLLWIVAFTGVCVLVALGKLKPETIEYLLFAIVGQQALKENKEKEKETK